MSRARASLRARFDAAREEAALRERCRELSSRAARSGAEEHEVCGARQETIVVRFEQEDQKLTQVDEATSLGLRVFDAKRLGYSSTNQTDAQSLDRTAMDALALARIHPPDEANALPEPAPAAEPLDLVRPELAELELEWVIEAGRRFVSAIRAVDPRLSIEQAEVRLSRGTRAVVTSGGVELCESDAALELMALAMAVDGDEVGGFHYVSDSVRDPASFETALQRGALELGRTAVENLGAGAGDSYRGPVLFAPDAFLEVFVGPLVSAASAIAVQRGRSALAGKLGQSIAAPLLTIVDDPRALDLAGATAFDREGQPARAHAIVEAGTLASFLYNGYAARVEKRSSTGHATGGPRSLPGLGPHALCVRPGGGGSLEELFARLGTGLFVRRFSGSVDPASGDFSGVAKSARWIEGGRPARALRECLIAGNAFELLQGIVALSSEAERVGGCVRAPYALVEGVSVTAG